MKMTLAGAAVIATAMLVAPAGAQNPAPSPGCFGLLFTDKAGDSVSASPTGANGGNGSPENMDLLQGWVDVKDGKSSVHIRLKNLTKAVPKGATSINWQVNYVGKAGTAAWVRAATDFSGLVTYDHGGVQATPAIPFNVRQGGTTGNFAEGPNGVVSIEFPEAVEPKGTTLKSFSIDAQEAVQAVPGAAPTPVKGGSLYVDDNAPGKGTFTIGSACPAGGPAAPPAGPTPGPAPAPAPTPGQPVATADNGGPLPVKVTTTKFKAKKVKKGMTLKLTSTEPLTQLAFQIKKGKKVFGKGALAKLSGKGKIKLKAKRLKKGTYVLDIVGTDGKGARRFTAAKITVR